MKAAFVLDTCALLFWTHDRSRLSPRAADALLALGHDHRAVVCSATFWEIALKIQAGRLDLGMEAREYLLRAQQLPISVVPVDAPLWLESVALDWGHRDPVDRLVVALARRNAREVLTCDASILAFGPAVW